MAKKDAKATTLDPRDDRIVVRTVENPTMSKGGLYIPHVAQEKPSQGTVVAVGPGRMNDKGERIPMDLKPGDRILFGKYAGTTVVVDEQEVLIIKEADVMANVRGG